MTRAFFERTRDLRSAPTLRAVLALAAASLFAGSAGAALVLNPNSPIAGQHTIVLDPVTFTVTTNGSLSTLVFEDFFQSNANGCGTNVGSTLTASINGGAAFALNTTSCNGLFGSTSGILDPNDLLINFLPSAFSVSVGQTVTIQGTTTFATIFGVTLPALNSNFGQVGQLGEQGAVVTALSAQTNLTAPAVVPEPNVLALAALGLVGIVLSRRKPAC